MAKKKIQVHLFISSSHCLKCQAESKVSSQASHPFKLHHRDVPLVMQSSLPTFLKLGILPVQEMEFLLWRHPLITHGRHTLAMSLLCQCNIPHQALFILDPHCIKGFVGLLDHEMKRMKQVIWCW